METAPVTKHPRQIENEAVQANTVVQKLENLVGMHS